MTTCILKLNYSIALLWASLQAELSGKQLASVDVPGEYVTTRPKGALCDKDLKNRPRVSGFITRDLTGASNNDCDGYENVT